MKTLGSILIIIGMLLALGCAEHQSIHLALGQGITGILSMLAGLAIYNDSGKRTN